MEPTVQHRSPYLKELVRETRALAGSLDFVAARKVVLSSSWYPMRELGTPGEAYWVYIGTFDSRYEDSLWEKLAQLESARHSPGAILRREVEVAGKTRRSASAYLVLLAAGLHKELAWTIAGLACWVL
jgi:hypothetical protein